MWLKTFECCYDVHNAIKHIYTVIYVHMNNFHEQLVTFYEDDIFLLTGSPTSVWLVFISRKEGNNSYLT
jgi:hypothetical protein